MTATTLLRAGERHDHVFLGDDHARSERRSWAVIALCVATMILEIVGGLAFGSVALVADGLHMSTHAGALLLAALAYTFARRHANDARFTFGTGKFGDLAGFASAIALAMIALLIGYEAASRLLAPVAIHVREALPIAGLGLLVNVASAVLLGAFGHGEGHHHGHHDHHHAHDHAHAHDGAHEHGHGRLDRDNNMRAALVHVLADAAVSVLVIAGLGLAALFGWTWMDPLVGIVGAVVIASWSVSLIRDTGAVLLDVDPAPAMADRMRDLLQRDGDRVADLHLWRLGPGHLGAIASVTTAHDRDAAFYHDRLRGLASLSHLTVEVARHRVVDDMGGGRLGENGNT